MIYVDAIKNCTPRRGWPWSQYCHLTADSLEELRAFAGRLNLKREWFCPSPNPRYLIYPGIRWKALRLGAVQLDEQQTKERQEKATAFRCDWCGRVCDGSIRGNDKPVCSESCQRIVNKEKQSNGLGTRQEQ